MNDASVMQVIRKITAVMMAASMLFVSCIPAVSAAACDMPGLGDAVESMQVESVMPLIDLGDCYIECGCRIDHHLDGMPHQLAPHALSMDVSGVPSVSANSISMAIPTLTARLLPFSTPPPRSI
ncbi:MAG: hypothetical protein ACE5DZ_08985 [Mariprofundus sp.]